MISRFLVLLLFVIAAGLLGRPASAASYELGTVPVPSSISIAGGTLGWPGTTHVLDTYTFNVSELAQLSAHAIELKFHQIVNFSTIAADLLDSSCGGCVVASASGTHQFLLSFANLLPSNEYVLQVTGTLGDHAIAGGYLGSLSVSEVPLPPALLLFGSALGVLAIARRRAGKVHSS